MSVQEQCPCGLPRETCTYHATSPVASTAPESEASSLASWVQPWPTSPMSFFGINRDPKVTLGGMRWTEPEPMTLERMDKEAAVYDCCAEETILLWMARCGSVTSLTMAREDFARLAIECGKDWGTRHAYALDGGVMFCGLEGKVHLTMAPLEK